MKRLNNWVLWLVLLAIFPYEIFAQATNAVQGLNIPAFTIPIPTQWAAWIAAHGLLVWLGIRGAIKFLDGFQTGRPWVAQLVSILEHISLNKNVATVDQKVVGADATPANVVVTPEEAKARIESKTDNGLPTGSIIKGPPGEPFNSLKGGPQPPNT